MMNNEEIKVNVDYVHKDTLTATDYVQLNKNNELLMQYNQQLLKENKDLQQKINKAIEYINKLKEYPYLERYYVGELLEILGGKE